jgi:hypothetical protein
MEHRQGWPPGGVFVWGAQLSCNSWGSLRSLSVSRSGLQPCSWDPDQSTNADDGNFLSRDGVIDRFPVHPQRCCNLIDRK